MQKEKFNSNVSEGETWECLGGSGNRFTVEVLEKGDGYAYCRVLDGPNEGNEQEFYPQHFDQQA